MKDNILAEKSYKFALMVIRVYKMIMQEQKEYVLARQFLKSGTSIGANVREAIGGQSRADFIAKLSIAYKESLETEYWISLLRDSGILTGQTTVDLLSLNQELSRLLSRILLTSKSKADNC